MSRVIDRKRPVAALTAAPGPGVFDTLMRQPGVRETGAFLCTGVALYLVAALVSYSATDPGWSVDGPSGVSNAVGRLGAIISDLLLSGIGYVAYALPAMILLLAWRLIRPETPSSGPLAGRPLLAVRTVAVLALLLSLVVLCALHSVRRPELPAGGGGILGDALAQVALPNLGLLGITLVASGGVILGAAIGLRVSWLHLLELVGRFVRMATHFVIDGVARLGELRAQRRQKEVVRERRQQAIVKRQVEVQQREAPKVLPVAPKPPESARAVAERQRELFARAPTEGLPELALLDEPAPRNGRGYSPEALEGLSRLLELKLRDFGVEVQVVAVQPGPVVTRFELQPAAGVKVSRITALVKDLARSLAVISVRVVEVIPGRSVVGIEIPNEDRETVRLREILSTEAYDRAESPLTMALGKDIAGEPMVADLTRMPHLLVAGTTGSGKSVGVNAMLLSLLFKATPEQVRLIMIDPKMLELSVYDGIPHLLTPVVTDMRDAAAALRWCVAEMDRRYQLMAALGVRNLASYNKKVVAAREKGSPIPDPTWRGEEVRELGSLPYIVVVVDEFADMMMIVGKKVEELIARIAQKARAAGIHLILATQRPSVDVITGLIKANIPGRLSFQVSSKIDSRTILDQGGAEQLLGHGDMLFLPPGTSLPIRIHGAFVSDEEVHRVADDWRTRGEPDYLPSITADSEDSGPGGSGAADGDPEQEDPLYDEAVAYVLESRRASISSVQRRLRIGYNRAARLIEAMEAAGVVSSMSSAGGREVLVPDHGE